MALKFKLKFRHILHAILLVACIFAIGNAAYNWLWSKDVKTIFQEENDYFPLPTITVCPLIIRQNYSKEYFKNATTLKTHYENMPPFANFINKANLFDRGISS